MTAVREDTDTRSTFSHSALFYRRRAEFLAATLPFVREGLARGEPVAVIVPPPNLEALTAALGADAARVRLIDMVEAGRNPGRIIPLVLRSFADSHPRPVRVVGEPVFSGRTDDEYPACVQHEALVNASFEGRPATLLCPYDTGRLAPSVLVDAEATHPVVVDDDGPYVSPRYAPDDAFERHNVPLPVPADALRVPFDLDGLTRARHTATDFAADGGFTGERLQDVALVVGELCANSVQHGGGAGLLRVWRDGDDVVCQVSDRGRPTDRLAGRRPATPHQDGGRGLLLVNQVADLVRTHVGPEGTTVRVALRR